MNSEALEPSFKSVALTEWDRKLIECIIPLAEDGFIHYSVFFANTFPLGFHYAWALDAAKKNVSKNLHLSSWERKLGDSKEKAFFWATKEKKDKNPNFVELTAFQPRYVFVQKTLATSSIFEKIRLNQSPEESKFIEFIDIAKQYFTAFEIYAETSELGNYLESKMVTLKDRINKYDPEPGRKLPLIDSFIKSNHSTLKFFIYGGPLSAYLKHKTKDYISFDMGLLTFEEAENLNLVTGVVIVGGLPRHRLAIETYHEILFSSAKSGSRKQGTLNDFPAFYSVYRAYNDMARLLQHRSWFRQPFEYATCIEEHHLAPGRPITK